MNVTLTEAHIITTTNEKFARLVMAGLENRFGEGPALHVRPSGSISWKIIFSSKGEPDSLVNGMIFYAQGFHAALKAHCAI